MAFTDLRNAFGSIHLVLILDMLSLMHILIPLLPYISDLYSKLSAFVSTKQWSLHHLISHTVCSKVIFFSSYSFCYVFN